MQGQGRERGAQLVGGIGHEAALRRDGLLQPAQQFIDAGDEDPRFQWQPRFGHRRQQLLAARLDRGR